MSDFVHSMLFSGSGKVKGIQVIRDMSVNANICKRFEFIGVWGKKGRLSSLLSPSLSMRPTLNWMNASGWPSVWNVEVREDVANDIFSLFGKYPFRCDSRVKNNS